MTPGARLAAAIEILDSHLAGIPAEKALTNWARRSRFAGSKDRAFIRDVVFDCLRKRDSYCAQGGALTGRALVMAHAGIEAAELFDGQGHAPAPLSVEEQDLLGQPVSERPDLPDWVHQQLITEWGSEQAWQIARASQDRAPLFLRVNARKCTVAQAQAALSRHGVETKVVPGVPLALRVLTNPRKVAQSEAYHEGLVEIQDASAQAICQALPEARRMLDYCAGGGGKVLAYGALHGAKLFAHDGEAARMADLPKRASRSGLKVQRLSDAECGKAAPFDLVLCDVPCSGSGTWRRAPEAKWRFSPEELARLIALQREILERAAGLTEIGGTLTYVTCSVLKSENISQIEAFADLHDTFELGAVAQSFPGPDGDGFFSASLTRLS